MSKTLVLSKVTIILTSQHYLNVSFIKISKKLVLFLIVTIKKYFGALWFELEAKICNSIHQHKSSNKPVK